MKNEAIFAASSKKDMDKSQSAFVTKVHEYSVKNLEPNFGVRWKAETEKKPARND